MPAPAPYLTPTEVRAKARGDALKNVHDNEIAALVAEFEEIAERYLGTAFRVRHITGEQVNVVNGLGVLAGYRPASPTAVDSTNAAVTVTVDTNGVLRTADLAAFAGYYSSNFGPPPQALTVSYDYGFAEPPAVVQRACAEYVRSVVVRGRGAQPENAISYSNPGGDSYRLGTPDWDKGRPTGFIEVDRLLNSAPNYRAPVLA